MLLLAPPMVVSGFQQNVGFRASFFMGGLPSLHLSEIWTFSLALFSFMFIWCQVKTKSTVVIRRCKPHYKEPGVGTREH